MMNYERESTPRRESRENYIRFILGKILSEKDAEEIMNTEFENTGRTIMDMIYTGEYEKAVYLAELFVETYVSDTDIAKLSEPALAMGG